MSEDFVLKDVPENRLYIPDDKIMEYWQLIEEASKGWGPSPVRRYKLFIFIRDCFPSIDFDKENYTQYSAEKHPGCTKPYLLKSEYVKKETN